MCVLASVFLFASLDGTCPALVAPGKKTPQFFCPVFTRSQFLNVNLCSICCEQEHKAPRQFGCCLGVTPSEMSPAIWGRCCRTGTPWDKFNLCPSNTFSHRFFQGLFCSQITQNLP